MSGIENTPRKRCENLPVNDAGSGLYSGGKIPASGMAKTGAAGAVLPAVQEDVKSVVSYAAGWVRNVVAGGVNCLSVCTAQGRIYVVNLFFDPGLYSVIDFTGQFLNKNLSDAMNKCL